jgi:hypothetical protein
MLLNRRSLSEGFCRDQEMPRFTKIATAAIVAALAGLSNQASAHGRHFPLTRCGPDLGYLCPMRGYFTNAPFHYNLAIHPGCIRTVRVETPNGVERRRAVVCGTPDRPMVWW